MITCERFEKDYNAWQSGRLTPEEEELFRRHVVDCPHCRAFTQGAYKLRELITSLPQVEPPPGFTYRLSNRISELSAKDIRTAGTRHGTIPRWTALGAGLASGLAVGLIIVLSPGKQDVSGTNNAFSNAPLASSATSVVNVVDTTDKSDDSLETPEQLYNLDRRQQMVSDRK